MNEMTLNNIYAFKLHKKYDVCFRFVHNYLQHLTIFMHSMCIRKMMFELLIITNETTLKNIYAFNVHKKDAVCFCTAHKL